MLKDTKSLGNNKAPACESRGFVHKKTKVRILTHLHFFILVLSFPIMRTFHNNLNWNDNINETLGEHTNKKELLPLFSKENSSLNRNIILIQ